MVFRPAKPPTRRVVRDAVRAGHDPGPSSRRGEMGVALVEFALCLPLLAIVVFGTIDLGRAYQTWEQVKNAAREGAIYASQHAGNQVNVAGSSCADPDNIPWHATNEGKAVASYTITITPADTNKAGCDPGPAQANLQPGQPITVKASTTFTLLTPFVGAFIGGNPTISASVQTRIGGVAG